MVVLSVLGFGAFLLVSLVVGVRLLLLARRTRLLPELSIGVALLSLGPLGYGLLFAARTIPELPSRRAVGLTLCGLCGLAVGSSALYFFVWRVFRPVEGWARAFAFVGFVVLAISTMGDMVTRALSTLEGAGLWFWVAFVMRAAPLAWGAVEAFRYWGMMRRRQVLGLAEPVVTRVLAYWGVGAGCAALAFGLALATRALTGLSVQSVPRANAAVSLLALVAAAAIWLAFFPGPSAASGARLAREPAPPRRSPP
jgi:hypothetical protein